MNFKVESEAISKGSVSILRCAALIWSVAVGAAAFAERAELPLLGSSVHNGPKTCVGAPCHGHKSPQDEAVWLNEGNIWRREDLHSRAYDVLLNKRSQRIAANLGLPVPAHEAKICLDCHSDNVAPEHRGEQFKLSEGIGCEACHGGSERWIKSHSSGSAHSDNLARGMFPTDDPRERATLCLSCHFGDETRFVDHRLMGAGHPRQSFELHVFSQVMPAHYEIDDDYRQRGKKTPSGIQVWGIGQAQAVTQILQVLLDEDLSHHGVWPEFVLFDCHACHHPLSDERWRPRPSIALGPGLARLNDANFLMLRHTIELISPAEAQQFQLEVRALHRAVSEGDEGDQVIARRLLRTVQSIAQQIEEWEVDSKTAIALLESILEEGLSGEYIDYAAAEQAAMALQVLIDALYTSQAYEQDVLEALASQLPSLLEATQDPEAYQWAKVRASLAAMSESLPARET